MDEPSDGSMNERLDLIESKTVSSSTKVGVIDKLVPTDLSDNVKPVLTVPLAIDTVRPLKNTEGKRSTADRLGRAITSFFAKSELAMLRE